MSEPSTLSENRDLLIAAGAGVVLFLVAALLLGFGGAVGVFGFAVYAAVWLAVAAFVLWMLYRLVVAVERIAHAQQRIAAAENPPSGSRATGAEGDSDGGGSDDASATDDGET